MATVTEPPWLNKTGGLAARNATASHTVTFPAATAGSLLVLIMAGAVTNTIASGWTKRQGPVSSAELSLWTRTAAGGETSVTVTHNGSNYPVGWLYYELPAGSSYTGSDSAAPGNDTWPVIDGLPGAGDPQVVIACRARAVIGAGSSSEVWNNPWVEDLDVTTPASGTDGIALTVGRAINVTAASITPSSTPTPAGSLAGDREVVLASFTVAALPAGPNEADATGSWSVAGSAAAARASLATAAGAIAWAGEATSGRPSIATATGAVSWAGQAEAARDSIAAAAGTISWAGTAVAEAPPVMELFRDLTIVDVTGPTLAYTADQLIPSSLTVSPVTNAWLPEPATVSTTTAPPANTSTLATSPPAVAATVQPPTVAATTTSPEN